MQIIHVSGADPVYSEDLAVGSDVFAVGGMTAVLVEVLVGVCGLSV